MNKVTKLLKISSLLVILTSIAIPLFNYFVGGNIVLDYIETKYLINLVVANTGIDFSDVSMALTSIVIAKDILVIITTGFYQILFLLILRSLIKKRKGLIRYIFLTLFHLLSYLGILLTYYFNSSLSIEFQFITIETYLIIGLQLINTLLFIAFTVLFIKEKLSNIRPVSPLSFLNAIYYILRTTTVILIVAFALITINIIVLYNLSLMVISNISFEELFNLPASLKYDLLSLFTNVPKPVRMLITSFEFRHWFFELVNAEVVVHIATLSTRVQAELTTIASKYFNTYFPTMAITLGYYFILQIINYLHKKLQFNNIIPVILMIATVIYGTMKLPEAALLNTINTIIIVCISLYVLLIVDKTFADYKVTNKICEVINKFKLSDSAKEFYDQVVTSSKELYSHSKKAFEKSKDKASGLKDKVVKKKEEMKTKTDKPVEEVEVKKEEKAKPKTSTTKKTPAKKKTTTTKKSTSTKKNSSSKKASSSTKKTNTKKNTK